MVRGVALLVGLLAAVPAVAGEMSAEEARRFVIGKLFSYTCFEGTRGQGRVYADGSVVGSIQFRGEGPVRYAALPAGTLQVKRRSGLRLAARPADRALLQSRADRCGNSFRGSVQGLGFAYCEFTRNQGRPHVIHSAHREHAPRSACGRR